MNRRLATVLVLLGLGALGFSNPAAGQEYLRHARVSFDEGGAMVRGAEENDWAQATLNTLVLPGDTLWVDGGDRAELEFSAGAYLRMADGSKAEIEALPPSGQVRGWMGSYYVQRLSRSTGDFVFHTPAAMVSVDNDTAVRVDVIEGGAATVTVRWGRATVRTDAGGDTVVAAGQRVWVDPGLLPSEPVPFDRSEEDAFDVWNRERAKALVVGYQTVPKTVTVSSPTIGVSDLGAYGEWVVVDSRPYWRPTVVVDYVPYRHGHWTYVRNTGHVWVGRYGFSYVTSHYGRWAYLPTHGWCWSYDPVWSPAWVATVRVGDYFVWSPIDYYHRPVVVGGAAFSVGGVRFGIYSTSYCGGSLLYNGPSYVRPCGPVLVDYYHSNPHSVHIWNIYSGSRYPRAIPYQRDFYDRVRDYSPNRSIRGPQVYAEGFRPAPVRARELEARLARSEFRAVPQTGYRAVRTVSSGGDRAARVRSVRVNTTDGATALARRGMDSTRAVRSSATAARQESPSRTVRGMSGTASHTRSETSTSTATRSESPSRTVRDSGAAATRTRGETSTSTATRSESPSRTVRGTGSTASRSTSGISSTTSRSPVRRTEPRTSGAASSSVRSSLSGSSSRPQRTATVDMDRTPSTTIRSGGSGSASQRSSAGIARTQPRTQTATVDMDRTPRTTIRSTPSTSVARTESRSSGTPSLQQPVGRSSGAVNWGPTTTRRTSPSSSRVTALGSGSSTRQSSGLSRPGSTTRVAPSTRTTSQIDSSVPSRSSRSSSAASSSSSISSSSSSGSRPSVGRSSSPVRVPSASVQRSTSSSSRSASGISRASSGGFSSRSSSAGRSSSGRSSSSISRSAPSRSSSGMRSVSPRSSSGSRGVRGR